MYSRELTMHTATLGNVMRTVRKYLANGLMPVSYTHLDVYKRQRILSQKITKNIFAEKLTHPVNIMCATEKILHVQKNCIISV